jgi:hypothetical protein
LQPRSAKLNSEQSKGSLSSRSRLFRHALVLRLVTATCSSLYFQELAEICAIGIHVILTKTDGTGSANQCGARVLRRSHFFVNSVPFEPGILCLLFRKPGQCSSSSYSPDTFALPAHYTFVSSGCQVLGNSIDMNVMSIMFEFPQYTHHPVEPPCNLVFYNINLG